MDAMREPSIQPEITTFATAAELIEARGNSKAFSEWLGCDIRRVSKWKREGFPAESYLELKPLFRAQGWEVADSAWNMGMKPTPYRVQIFVNHLLRPGANTQER